MIDSVLLKRLSKLKIAIVTHVYATGPAQELESYLKDKVKSLIFIGHPFKFAASINSFYKIYQEHKLSKESKTIAYKLPEIFTYFKDIIYSFYWINSCKGRFDIYFGVDPLNALVGIILKKLRKVRKVIYYTIDYSPRRFKNRLLNWIYHRIDSFCVLRSDFVWNLSDRMMKERLKKGINKIGHQIVVPIGVNFENIKRLSEDKINRKHLVYMGHLRSNQGLELIIDAFKSIVKEVPDSRLVIIGGGSLESKIRKMVSEEGLSNSVDFHGYIPEHADVEKILITCGIGLALYEPSPDSVTWYTDPSKPKQYMATGLPVIITSVPSISEEVRLRNLGIVVDYDKGSLVDGVLRLFRDDNFYFDCRRNAIEFSSKMSWNNIFSDTLAKCL